jgi:hypothetical protein
MCFLSEVGIPRALDPIDINEEPLRYHAEGVAEFTTIFATSVLYNFRQGRPTPQYHSGGNGLRCIEAGHAENILMDTLQAALDEEINPLTPRGLVLVREIEVIERIQQRYFDIHPPHNLPVGNIHLLPPDKDLGPLGEEIVFLREIQEVIRIGLGANVVE